MSDHLERTADNAPDSGANARLTYAFRPRPFSRPVELTLDERALTVTLGTKERRIPLNDITSIRLQFRPRNTQNEGYVAKVMQKGAPTLTLQNLTWVSLVEIQRQDHDYRQLVEGLVQATARRRSDLILKAGLPEPVFAMAAIVGPAAVAMMLFIAIMALVDRNWPIALLVGGLAAYFGHWTWRYLTRNRPMHFSADAIPESVLPKP
jgi:hypothetical protein